MFTRPIMPVIAAVLGVALATPASAGFVGGYETTLCPGGTCQTVNFHSAGVGNPILGDTNPAPVYNVQASTPDAGIVLHGSGQVVDTRLASDISLSGPGFGNLLLTPLGGYAWTFIEFQLNSTINIPVSPGVNNGLTLTAYDINGVAHVLPLTGSYDFPWESNNGQNQHYFVQANGGDIITSLLLTYIDPNCVPTVAACNFVGDMHNIDVQSVLNPAPEPSSLFLLGAPLVGFGLSRLRRSGSA